MCVDCRRMNSSPGRFWWRGRHARAEKRWRCSRACILKSKLDRYHEIKLKTKVHLWLWDFCQQNFQNIVTWGVKLQSHNVGFACFSRWRAELVVCCLQFTQKSTHFLNLNESLSPNEPWIFSNSPVLLSDIYFWSNKIKICHSFLLIGKSESLKTNCL